MSLTIRCWFERDVPPQLPLKLVRTTAACSSLGGLWEAESCTRPVHGLVCIFSLPEYRINRTPPWPTRACRLKSGYIWHRSGSCRTQPSTIRGAAGSAPVHSTNGGPHSARQDSETSNLDMSLDGVFSECDGSVVLGSGVSDSPLRRRPSPLATASRVSRSVKTPIRSVAG